MDGDNTKKNCAYCGEDGTGECQTCLDGFSNIAGKCDTPCIGRDTKSCDPNNASIALTCKLGFPPYCTPNCQLTCADDEVCAYGDVCAKTTCIYEDPTDHNRKILCGDHGKCVDGACVCDEGSNRSESTMCRQCLLGFEMNEDGECVKPKKKGTLSSGALAGIIVAVVVVVIAVVVGLVVGLLCRKRKGQSKKQASASAL